MKWKSKVSLVFSIVLVGTVILQYFGFFDRLAEISYDQFMYPMEIDVVTEVERIQKGLQPLHKPIEEYSRYKFLSGEVTKCNFSRSKPHLSGSRSAAAKLIIVIKTRPISQAIRDAIRSSWGRQRTVTIPSLQLHVASVFLIGHQKQTITDPLHTEIGAMGDMVVYSFVDSYVNNTIKMVLGFRWVSEHCSEADYALFVDDDYHVNLFNMARYIRHIQQINDQATDQGLIGGDLYAGRRLFVAPIRQRGSVWRLRIEEYPYNRFPPYINAGAYLMSYSSVRKFWLASRFVKYLAFDDVYAGILAKKLKINPKCAPGFMYHNHDEPYDPIYFRHVIAAHGFSDTDLQRRAYEDTERFEKGTGISGFDWLSHWRYPAWKQRRTSCWTSDMAVGFPDPAV